MAQGANINARDEAHNRPVHLCCKHGDKKTLFSLLAAAEKSDEFDINCVNLQGWSCLLLLCNRQDISPQNYHDLLEMIQYLLEKGANPLMTIELEDRCIGIFNPQKKTMDCVQLFRNAYQPKTKTTSTTPSTATSPKDEHYLRILHLFEKHIEKYTNVYKLQLELMSKTNKSMISSLNLKSCIFTQSEADSFIKMIETSQTNIGQSKTTKIDNDGMKKKGSFDNDLKQEDQSYEEQTSLSGSAESTKV